MDVFKNNGNPENFINSCFETLPDSKLLIQEEIIPVSKKPLLLVLPYPGPLSIQTRTKLKKFTVQKMKFSIKDFFSTCYQIHMKEILNGKLHF